MTALKKIIDMTPREIENAEWAVMAKALNDAHTLFNQMGYSISWLIPMIGIAEQRVKQPSPEPPNRQELIDGMLHPEFGTEWREDGIIGKAVTAAKAEERERCVGIARTYGQGKSGMAASEQIQRAILEDKNRKKGYSQLSLLRLAGNKRPHRENSHAQIEGLEKLRGDGMVMRCQGWWALTSEGIAMLKQLEEVDDEE